ncbi:MAG: topoisomerase [Verrucomicrobiaceae bacterium]|nr:topoisomerase [Verrucomicrobiaceae bacterium]
MFWMLILAVAFFVFIIFTVSKAEKNIAGSVGLPYLPESTLFSAAERSFLEVLDQAVGPDNRVFGKVRVADIARVKPGLSNSARRAR